MQSPTYPSSSVLKQTSSSKTKNSKSLIAYFNDFIPKESTIDKKYQTQKLKIIAYLAMFGALGGHSYASWRGFTRLKLWARHVVSGTIIGLSVTFPFFTFRNISEKNHPIFYVSIHGAICGSFVGYMHRGLHHIPMYAVLGIGCYLSCLIFWDQAFKPAYYGHFLKWPEYEPPYWWPYQHMTGIELLDSEIERERLNVIYPQDIQYLIEQEYASKGSYEQKQIENNLEIEETFVYESEINERKQLENPSKNWFFH